tara:strand:- start:1505 stop:1843 length:339 start_codon:yes stop_codon:yes gene_type:complete
MPTEEMYKKYEANQTKDKVVESSAGGLFEGEHFDQNNPSGKLYYEHPSQEEINAMAAASHKPITSYEDMPENIKNKPGLNSDALLPNVAYIEMVGATQRPGDRRLGQQDIEE